MATATGRNAKATAEQFGFSFCTTDYRELIARDDIDTVLIATRHDTHAKMTAESLRAGKTVFVEKPLATTIKGLNEVSGALKQSNGRLMVGFNRRFSSLSIEFREFFKDAGPLAINYRVNAGPIPKESWIQGEEGGGRIIGEVCHFVDFLQFLTGAETAGISAIQCAAGEDTVSIIISLSDGSIGNINYFANGDRGFPKERIEAFGGGRTAVLDDFRTLEMWRDGKRKISKRLSQDKGFDQELNAFVDAVVSGGEMPISWRSLEMTTMATIDIVESILTDSEIDSGHSSETSN